MLNISICVPACNEEKNIGKLLTALCGQKTEKIKINKIVVISSGSTDKTNEIVQAFCDKNQNIILVKEPERSGKASAINTFLKIIDDEIVVIESADTIPNIDTMEKLCIPFLNDEKIGMTGGAPFPVNDPNTFLGYIIHAWWWFHRNIPRFGEIIAFRNIIENIPKSSAVDEAYIQAVMIKKNYKVVHIDKAVVYNKGPETVADLIKQRRRIFNGHARLQKDELIKIDNMTKSSLRLMLFDYEMKNLKHLVWFLSGILIEVYARLLGTWDMSVKNYNPAVWDMADSTKDLSVKEEDI
ncbi:MAG: hypothetical protein A2687_03690 [Candidatus Levybacteria bacterium RIFCSPHIGHO2_01_FULL_38_26]|nr:MAG: hypothetical protein A2687_03690 [Candidatus Levybacteria bacterium RIFCSPHIGHO2_01_FULL_38_26]